MNHDIKALAACMALALAAPALAQEQDRLEEWQGEARDAWIDGKLEASYLINTELNNFDIVTRVENGNVVLTGSVGSETEKELAGEIARNLDGVVSVDNQLMVAPEAAGDEADADIATTDSTNETEADADSDSGDRTFSTRFWDLTTTARLKSSYAINDELEAMAIDIDTRNGVVTLDGTVATEAQKQLAEEIARGYDHVVRVENNLVVGGGEDSVAEDRAAVDDPRV